MKSIRGATDRYLWDKAGKAFSIVGDSAFHGANKVLDPFLKDLRKTGKIAGILHKKPMTADQPGYLFDKGELGPASTKKTLPSYSAQLRFILPSSSGKEAEKINAISRKVCSFYEKPLMAENILKLTRRFQELFYQLRITKGVCKMTKTNQMVNIFPPLIPQDVL